jgi:hypothetical protein
MFGPKMEEATGGCKKLHNDTLHNLYFSPDIIRMMIDGVCCTHEGDEQCLQSFVLKI